jgi:copper(I)-binding protein
VRVLALLWALVAGPAPAGPTDAVVVEKAWIRTTVPGVPVAAGYATLRNVSAHAETLVAVDCPVAASAELHETTMSQGMTGMRPAGKVEIAPGQSLKLEPGGRHLMLTGLRGPLVVRGTVPLVFRFASGLRVSTVAVVLPLNSTQGP